MGGCGTCGGWKRCILNFAQYPERRYHSEDMRVESIMVLEIIFKKSDGNMDCIVRNQGRDKQGALVNNVMYKRKKSPSTYLIN